MQRLRYFRAMRTQKLLFTNNELSLIDVDQISLLLVVKSLHGQVVKGAGHLGHDEAMKAAGREFDPRPGHYVG